MHLSKEILVTSEISNKRLTTVAHVVEELVLHHVLVLLKKSLNRVHHCNVHQIITERRQEKKDKTTYVTTEQRKCIS